MTLAAFPDSLNTSPMLPPRAPAFRHIVRRVADITEQFGPRGGALYCWTMSETMVGFMARASAGDIEILDRMRAVHVTTHDLMTLCVWLEARACELEGSVV